MTEEKTIEKKEVSEVAKPEIPEQIYVPAVDIYETEESIQLLVDMPGVNEQSVDVSVENGVLRIEGKGKTESPEDYELVGQEFTIGKLHRDFALSEKVDIEKIKGKIKNGLLEVTIPKREEVKTKKVTITN